MTAIERRVKFTLSLVWVRKVFGTVITHVRSLWWTRFISLSENECRLGRGFAETRLREIELFTRPPVKRRRDVNRRFEICLRGNFRTSSIFDALKYLPQFARPIDEQLIFEQGLLSKASKPRVVSSNLTFVPGFWKLSSSIIF